MNTTGRILAAVLFAAATSSCYSTFHETVYGSGFDSADVRVLPGSFRSVQLMGGLDVHVTAGAEESVRVVGDDNLLPYVRTELDGSTLEIHIKDGYWLNPMPTVEVTLPDLESASIAGSGDMVVGNLDCGSIRVSIAGSGDLRAEGRVDELHARIAGSGDMQLYGLQAERANVSIAGSGDMQVFVTSTLEASVSGSGDIRYRGGATVDASIAGSGSVRAGG